LAHVTLISLIKDKFNVELSAEDFNQFENVADIIQKIGAQKFN
jgi:acyl carrier protein